MLALDLIHTRNSDGRLVPLPEWSRFFYALGRFVVETAATDARVVVGVSVPTRSFAAPFVALGSSAAAYRDPEGVEPRSHFEWVASHPKGTPLRFRKGEYLCRATLVGSESRGEVEYLVLNHEGRLLRPWDRCGDVDVLEADSTFTNKRELLSNREFVGLCAPSRDPFAHASHTQVDTVLVGVVDLLRSELVDQRFVAAGTGAQMEEGALNDLMRCDPFENNANDHDRVKVVSSRADLLPELVDAEPPIVVFDGGNGYLRHRSKWPRSSQVVILDRTLSSAIDGAAAFNQERAYRLDDLDFSVLGAAPSGVEMVGHLEALS